MKIRQIIKGAAAAMVVFLLGIVVGGNKVTPLEYEPLHIVNGNIVDSLAFSSSCKARAVFRKYGQYAHVVLFETPGENGSRIVQSACFFTYKDRDYVYYPYSGTFRATFYNSKNSKLDELIIELSHITGFSPENINIDVIL